MSGVQELLLERRLLLSFRPVRFALTVLLVFSLLVTGGTSIYLNALQNLSEGPRTERMESGLVKATFREAELHGKKRLADEPLDSSDDDFEPLWTLIAAWPELLGLPRLSTFHPTNPDLFLSSRGEYRPNSSRAPPSA